MKTLLMVAAVLGIFANDAQAAWLAPDFHVADSQLAKVARGERKAPKPRVADPASCGDRIPSIMCLVDPRDPANPEAERTCLPGSELYASPLQKVFQALTPTFQEMFCSIDHFYVEKQLGATGYAGIGDDGSISIGIRQTVLDTELSFQKWATWKEQLSFGGRRDSYEATAGLSFFVMTPVSGVSDFLYQFLVHEIGHQFDFANAVNAQEARCAEDEERRESCPFLPGTWGSLSWQSPELPLFENDFPGRRSFCFYGCGIVTASEQAPGMYRGLWDSSFINAYAATNPYDDFADGLAYYAADKYLGQRISIDDGQGTRFDLTSKLKSARFKKKLKYIESFLSRNDIQYP